ncbi:MAG: DoxX family protein [Chthoniobacterales bacterium]
MALMQGVSVAAFLFYGAACLVSPKLVAEFERYRLGRFRVTIGLLEMAGAMGLLAGQFFPLLKIAAAAGLAILMLCGLWARWRIRDPWHLLLPALGLGLANAAIVVWSLGPGGTE